MGFRKNVNYFWKNIRQSCEGGRPQEDTGGGDRSWCQQGGLRGGSVQCNRGGERQSSLQTEYRQALNSLQGQKESLASLELKTIYVTAISEHILKTWQLI